MARWLAPTASRRRRILVSPAVRTQQTAAALTVHSKPCRELAPGASVGRLLRAARWPDADDDDADRRPRADARRGRGLAAPMGNRRAARRRAPSCGSRIIPHGGKASAVLKVAPSRIGPAITDRPARWRPFEARCRRIELRCHQHVASAPNIDSSQTKARWAPSVAQGAAGS